MLGPLTPPLSLCRMHNNGCYTKLMEKVTGIGGLFFRSKDPQAPGAWYEEHLGITIGEQVWNQEAGMTVFAPFAEESDYFPPSQRWMINFRVRNLDAMIAQLRSSGIEVETKAEWDTPEVGKFARIYDPEGNPIELWEPAVQ